MRSTAPKTLACLGVATMLAACASAPRGGAAAAPSPDAAPTGSSDAMEPVPVSRQDSDLENGVEAAAAPLPAPASDRWRVTLTPYIWLAGIDGETSSDGGSSGSRHHDLPLVETSLDFALMGHLEFGKGNWSIFLDGTYADLSGEGSASRSVLRDVGTASADLETDLTVALAEVGVAWRVCEFQSIGGRAQPVEILGGLRWNSIDLDASLDTSLAGPRRRFENQFDGNFSTQWTDPFVGVRTRIPLFGPLGLTVRGDIGGFGVGSDLAWNVVTGLVADVGGSVEIFAGYRWYDFRRDASGHDIELMVKGPAIGVAIGF